jgi:CBS domain-containing protein
MSVASEVLRTKPTTAVYSIPPDTDVLAAVRMLAELKIGALLVMEHGRLRGIFSERDVVRALAARGDLAGALVSELMTGSVRCVRPQQSSEECMGLMTEARVRHLPVIDEEDAVIGLVSIGDLVKDTISDQAFVIEQLEHYIMGAPS